MKQYAIKIAVTFTAMIIAAVYALAHAGEPTAKPAHQGYIREFTAVIITETYHGSSMVQIPHYPTLADCENALGAVRYEDTRMGNEPHSDYLYTDAYCVPSYEKP